MDEALQTLGAAGPLGAVVLFLGWAYWQVSLELKRVQEARVADAQRVAAAALEREEKWQSVLSQLADAVERVADRTAASGRTKL